jgi:hypothetical protein
VTLEQNSKPEPWFSVLVADAERRTAGKGDIVHALRDGLLYLLHYTTDGRVITYRLNLPNSAVSLQHHRDWLAVEMAKHGYPEPGQVPDVLFVDAIRAAFVRALGCDVKDVVVEGAMGMSPLVTFPAEGRQHRWALASLQIGRPYRAQELQAAVGIAICDAERETYRDVCKWVHARVKEKLTHRQGAWEHLVPGVTVTQGRFDEAHHSVGHYGREFAVPLYLTVERRMDLVEEIAWAAIQPYAKADAHGRAPWKVGDRVVCALTGTYGVVVDTTDKAECFVYWNWRETVEKWVPSWKLVPQPQESAP